jgi:ornithine decarboxylase
MTDTFADAAEMTRELRPDEPVYCLRPHVLKAVAARFIAAFPGDVLYAVKCNDRADVLQGLFDGGIRHFDVASPAEIAAVAALSGEAIAHFMHPVKNRRAVAEAYRRFRIRSYALDHLDEFDKILDATGQATDLTLVVRLDMPKFHAVCDLSGKFGAELGEAVGILHRIAASGNRAGLTFHVGSQCLDPHDYTQALAICGRVIEKAGVPIDLVDVGGGFPARYADVVPPPLEAFVDAIRDGFHSLKLPHAARLLCEPGRALVADAVSLVVRIEARQDRGLYLNDGVYGSLADMKYFGTTFPMRLIRDGHYVEGQSAPFRLFGPTCDSHDCLIGPYELPADVREGDYIELGQTGAYSQVLQTNFNGFGARRAVNVKDGSSFGAALVPGEEARAAA